jgi:hypothetical protein
MIIIWSPRMLARLSSHGFRSVEYSTSPRNRTRHFEPSKRVPVFDGLFWRLFCNKCTKETNPQTQNSKMVPIHPEWKWHPLEHNKRSARGRGDGHVHTFVGIWNAQIMRSTSDRLRILPHKKMCSKLRKTCKLNPPPPPVTASHGQIVNEGNDVFAPGSYSTVTYCKSKFYKWTANWKFPKNCP